MLVLHIFVAISSVGLSTFLYFYPSVNRLRASYALTAFTFASGVYLVVAGEAAMLRTCMMGLLYVGVSVALMGGARQKLAAQNNRNLPR